MKMEMEEVYNIGHEIQELEKYAQLEGSEIGELCSALIQTTYLTTCASDNFRAALVKEIKDQLKMFKDNTEIVEKEITSTQKCTELEWLY